MAEKTDSKKNAERNIPPQVHKGQGQDSSGRGQVPGGRNTERRLWRDARKRLRPGR